MTQAAIIACEMIRKRFPGVRPKIAIVLGSGLDALTEEIQDFASIDYDDLPGFHKPSVQGHAGQLGIGTLSGTHVICLRGRPHWYEKADHLAMQTKVRTCFLLGCRTWFATNASGSLHPHWLPGHLVAIQDHINFQANNPLVGKNDDRFGPRFISLEDAYDPLYRQHVLSIGQVLHVPISEGVYVATLGPSFETPAEIRAYRKLGADIVGMSTIAEIIIARHCGMRTVAVSVITNLAAGMHPVAVTHEETLKGAALGAPNLIRLIKEFISTYVD